MTLDDLTWENVVTLKTLKLMWGVHIILKCWPLVEAKKLIWAQYKL